LPLNRDFVGKAYGDVEFAVERDRIVQFADAIGDDDPRYRSEEPLAPPTFPTVLQIQTGGQVVLDPELGLDYTRVVHGEQEYVIDRPMRAGGELTARPRIADIYAKESHASRVVETMVTDATGATVSTG